jgi:hypothetical protein
MQFASKSSVARQEAPLCNVKTASDSMPEKRLEAARPSAFIVWARRCHREGRRKPHPVWVGRNAPAPLCAILLIGVGAPTQRRVTVRPPLPSLRRLPPAASQRGREEVRPGGPCFRSHAAAGSAYWARAGHLSAGADVSVDEAAVAPQRRLPAPELRWRRETSSWLQPGVSDSIGIFTPRSRAVSMASG